MYDIDVYAIHVAILSTCVGLHVLRTGIAYMYGVQVRNTVRTCKHRRAYDSSVFEVLALAGPK